jgi:hypothetical protein
MDFNNMPKIYLFFILFGIACQACSQPATTNTTPASTTNTPPAEQPKPAAYTSEKEGWLVDLDEAYAVSAKEKKPILVNFTGVTGAVGARNWMLMYSPSRNSRTGQKRMLCCLKPIFPAASRSLRKTSNRILLFKMQWGSLAIQPSGS